MVSTSHRVGKRASNGIYRDVKSYCEMVILIINISKNHFPTKLRGLKCEMYKGIGM